MAGGPTRVDSYTVNVRIDGIDWGTFDKMTGGEVDSEEVKFRPGGLKETLVLGGPKTYGNINVSRLYRLARDHDNIQKLLNGIGRSRVVVSKAPHDLDGNRYGKGITYSGILKRIQFPEYDSNSAEVGMVEIEVSVESVAGF